MFPLLCVDLVSGTSRPEVRRTHTLIRKPIRLLSRSLKTSIRFFFSVKCPSRFGPEVSHFFESLCQVVELILRCAGICFDSESSLVGGDL